MQRIIDTSQKLANMNINLNPQVVGTVGMANGLSVKNQNLLSPDNMGVAAGVPQQNQNKVQVIHNYQSVFSPQSQQQQARI